MPFKPASPAHAPTALAGFELLAVAGADAAAFLQAQTMNDVRALEPGHWQWNGWLTPKGRVVALFALLRTAPDAFLLVLPDHPAEELRAALQRFVFRSKVVMTVDRGHVAAAGPVVDGRGWTLDWDGAAGDRTLVVVPADAAAPPSPAVDAAWRAADIARGVPRLGPAQRAAWTPQMLSLERLAAFSLKKGCYPGQEIVARTHYLGQAKRGLARLRGAAIAEGDAVHAGVNAVGTVVCVDASGTDALAVVSADAGDPLSVPSGEVSRSPLN